MASRRDAKPSRHRFVPVWDVVVRLLHWTLAALVTVDLVRDDGDRLHRIVGYAAVAVVLVRLGWAAVSRSHGSFANLRPSVSASLAYVRLIVRGQARRPLGHNPLGLWMAWLLWTLVLMLGLSGWMTRLDAFWGDERVHDFHALLADMLLVAAILHLVGVATMSLLWKENLPASMVTGFKRADKANVD
jgi:cytochrome b